MADIDERFAAYVRDRGEHHLRVAVLLTGDWHAAEDLVQASLVKALVQVRLIPVYRRLPVTPGSWAFTFAYAAAAADALVWLAITKPPAATGYAIAVITLLTAFASWIAFGTVVVAAARRDAERLAVAEKPPASAGP
jgi:tellurite resistance protein